MGYGGQGNRLTQSAVKLMGKVPYHKAGRPARSAQHLVGRHENLSLIPRTWGLAESNTTHQYTPDHHRFLVDLSVKRIVRKSSFPRKETKNPDRRHYFPILKKKYFLISHARGVTWKQNQNVPNARKHQTPKRTQKKEIIYLWSGKFRGERNSSLASCPQIWIGLYTAPEST